MTGVKRVRLHLPPGGVHPVYRLLTESPHVDRAEGVHWNVAEDGALTMVHRLWCDPEAVAARLAAIDPVETFELLSVDGSAPRGDGTDSRAETYVFLRDEGTDDSRRLFRSLAVEGVVTVPPIEYDDGGAAFTVVGEDEAIGEVVESVPDGFGLAVERVGSPGPAFDPTAELSERQREAAAVGVDLGYFDVPRRASHEDVAERLGCSPSTAAEHLQKAQARIVRSAFEER